MRRNRGLHPGVVFDPKTEVGLVDGSISYADRDYDQMEEDSILKGRWLAICFGVSIGKLDVADGRVKTVYWLTAWRPAVLTISPG